MATSQNGWGVHTSAPAGKLQWITGRTRPGDVQTVLDYLCRRFNSEVEKIIVGHSWGWAYRPIRGSSSGYSNHASGTAIDLNAPAHPLGVSGTFTTKQRQRVHQILGDLDGAIRWGGDYSGRKDEMHFEVNTTAARLAAVAKKIRNGNLPATVNKPTYKPKPWKVNLTNVREQFLRAAGLTKGKVQPNNGVARIQQALNAELKAGLKVDGYAGKSTLLAWQKWERKVGISGRHRIPDPQTIRPLGKGRFNWYVTPKK